MPRLTCALHVESKGGIPREIHPNLKQKGGQYFLEEPEDYKATTYVNRKLAPEPNELRGVSSNLFETAHVWFQGRDGI